MRSQAKAPSAGSISAKRLRPKLSLALLCTLAFCLLPASQALAKIIVDLDGAGAGTVTSSPPGIECSNVPGEEKEAESDCTHVFGSFEFVELSATPSSSSLFTGWSGSIGVVEAGGTCNASAENPCFLFDLEGFGAPFDPVTVKAGFECQAPINSPVATTEGNGAGSEPYLAELEGAVNPEGCGLEACEFEYGQSTDYGQSTPCVPGTAGIGKGTSNVPVSASTEPLEPNTTYHYRLLASGPGGTSAGEDRTFTTGPVTDEGCSDPQSRERRAEQGINAILLPDCMALEMVSPPNKGGQAAFSPAVSAEGGRVRFQSLAALGGTPGSLSTEGDPYIATRGPSEWTTSYTSPPVADISGGWEAYATALSFTPDFSRWFQIASTWPQYQQGIGRVFEGGLGGIFNPISPLLVPLVGGNLEHVRFAELQGASEDHSRLYFTPGRSKDPATYLPGDPEPSGDAADPNTYIVRLDTGGNPALELLARDRSGKVWGGSCGARLGGIRGLNSRGVGDGARDQGAISSDGGRVYLSARPDQAPSGSCDPENKLRILERLESKQGPWIGPLFSSECTRAAPACSPADGNDYYQGASLDGSRVYFTTNRQLADSDLDTTNDECSDTVANEGCDLYLYDSTLPPGHRLIQVSAGGSGDPTPGKGAEVFNGITAVSGDGSHVYFVAEGVLTSAQNPAGDVAQAGEPNLYVWDRETEDTAFVGTLDPGDAVGGNLWGGSGIYAVPELGDGNILPFVSRAALTADDEDGTHRDVFRYDAGSEELVRISKAAPGGADNGPFDVGDSDQNVASLGTDFAERGRHVSEDGETLVFRTSEGLVPGDVNGELNGYLWRNGQLYRLPGRLNTGPVISHAGSTLAFASSTPLLPQDGDTSVDVYAARAGGGYPEPKAPEPCRPDETLLGPHCQGSTQPPPAAPNVGSGNPPSPGNVQPKPRCRKGQVRRRGRCVKRTRRHQRKHARQANADRRAAK